MTRCEERGRDKKIAEITATQLSNWISGPAIQCPLNVRVDITLKQRIDSELETRRSSSSPAVRYSKLKVVNTFIPALNAVVPVKRCRIEALDDRKTVNVGVKQGRTSLKDAALQTPFYFLTEDEARKLPVRVMNRLNRELFGHRTRRANNPEKLTALITMHDKGDTTASPLSVWSP